MVATREQRQSTPREATDTDQRDLPKYRSTVTHGSSERERGHEKDLAPNSKMATMETTPNLSENILLGNLYNSTGLTVG